MTHRSTSLLLVVICLALPALAHDRAGSARAQAVAPAVSAPVQVSGPSPFAAGCEQAPQTTRVYPNSAVETHLAVDPLDSQHLVAVWQQDRFSAGASRGNLAAVSHDGGVTWTDSLAPFARCEGGTADNGGDYERASDPWVSVAPNGDVYQSALATDAPETSHAITAILVSKSTDGGATWGAPATIIRNQLPDGFNDKESITADLTDANTVYVVWDRLKTPPIASGNLNSGQPASQTVAPVMFSRSTDAGASWEAPHEIYNPLDAPDGGAVRIGETTSNIITVLPDGNLIDVFVRARAFSSVASGFPAPPIYDVVVIRSTDKGETWSDPVSVSVESPGQSPGGVQDPYSGQVLRTGGILPTIAVDRQGGQLYVAWQDARFSRGQHADIVLTTSTDEGQTWSDPVRVNQTPGNAPAFTPSIAVLDDGSVGVSYYDLRNTTPAQDATLADVWLTTCRAGCSDSANWSEAHVAGSFDMQRAPYSEGFFLGDYEGLAAAGAGFQILFAASDPPGSPDLSDAFSASALAP